MVVFILIYFFEGEMWWKEVLVVYLWCMFIVLILFSSMTVECGL